MKYQVTHELKFLLIKLIKSMYVVGNRYASSRDVLSSEMNLKINSQSYSAMQLGR